MASRLFFNVGRRGGKVGLRKGGEERNTATARDPEPAPQRELDRAKALAPNEGGHWDFVAKSN